MFFLFYIVGFGVLGLTGFFGKGKKDFLMYVGITLAGFCRFAASFISGVVFYASYAPQGQNVFLYSLVYNGTYMLPEVILCIVVAALIGKRLVKIMKSSIH